MTGIFSNEIVALLDAPLSQDHVKDRTQAGRKVDYIEGWHVINEANRIFGYDGWSRETVMSECCYAAEYDRAVWENGRKTNKTVTSFRCTYRAKVRIRVGEIVREGSGHGNGFGDNPGDAHESAEKEAETDAMKRAFITFGNQFGLALYDKAHANVEAPTRPTAAPGKEQQFNWDYATARSGEIANALKNAHAPSGITEIWGRFGKDLDLIDKVRPAFYKRLETLRDEMLAKLGPPARPAFPIAGSAPELMGEP